MGYECTCTSVSGTENLPISIVMKIEYKCMYHVHILDTYYVYVQVHNYAYVQNYM